jgi:HSP20 family protein
MSNALTANNVQATRQNRTFVPRVDIFESEHELTLYADMPGVRPEEIDLRYEQGQLTLSSRTNPATATGRALMSEYQAGDFQRVFKIHESIDASKIEAENKNGVLIVHLPKVEAAKPKQVAVKVG